jgi:hypothetical protein
VGDVAWLFKKNVMLTPLIATMKAKVRVDKYLLFEAALCIVPYLNNRE